MGRKKTIKTIDEVLENSKTDQQPQEENLVKKTCRELGITQKELAEITKFKEQTIRNWSSKGGLPDYAEAFFNIILKFHYHKETLVHFLNFSKNIQSIKI
jgi:DNA-binding XRE family transcriptional regulator